MMACRATERVSGVRIRGRRRLRDQDELKVGTTVIAFRAPAGGGSIMTFVPEQLQRAPRLGASQRAVLVALARPYKRSSGFATPATNKDIAAEVVLTVNGVKSRVAQGVGTSPLRALLGAGLGCHGLVTGMVLLDHREVVSACCESVGNGGSRSRSGCPDHLRDHGSRASYDGSRGSQHQAPAGPDIKRSLCEG